jgi:aspartyl-tRNA(Asn)/glutamyl-tRNA(Gln) amidotransferase subunit B
MNVPVTPGKLIKGATGDWEIVIGMEVHAQVTSRSKLFSGASTVFGGEPNDHVSLVDAAMPGMLPVINKECVRQAVRTGLGLNAKINLRSVFDRKNYFYPDLPQGYQISQYKSPIVGEGEVTVELDGGKTATIGIERLHLEQDAGKLLHDQSPTMSYVDLNRSGVALMEIVSKPDIRDAEQAKAYVSKLRSILRYLGTCDGDMEKGNLRADVNVSVRRPGEPLGTRCEIKNMNSITFIGQAIEHEARRQIEILEDGGIIEQETRLFDPNKLETRSMRTKEEAHDYRYFPDPDLLPLELSQDFIDELKAELPELPDQKRTRFLAELGLSAYDASVLVAERESADFYEAVLAELKDRRRDGKAAANWVINELFGRLNKEGKAVSASPVDAGQLAAIVGLIGEGTISGKIAKDLFEIVWREGGDPRLLVEARGLKQVTDVSAIETIVDDIISANPDKVAQAKAKPAAIQWFVGQVMKATGGKADPKTVNALLKEKLGV